MKYYYHNTNHLQTYAYPYYYALPFMNREAKHNERRQETSNTDNYIGKMQDAEDLQSRLKTHTVNIFVHKLLKCWVLLSLQHIEEYKDRTCCHAELWL